jgi:hypothetical protein
MTEQPLAGEAMSLAPAALRSPSLWSSQIALSTSLTPTAAYAGMFQRVAYELVMTGTGAVKIDLTLPREVLIEPTRLPPATGYDETQHLLRWHVDLDEVSPYHFHFEGVTDLLARPGDLVFKTIAYPASTAEPIIDVSTVTLTAYQKQPEITPDVKETGEISPGN